MADIAVQVDIPNRALFKPAEVCEIVRVQPYVLRSWEAEFPALGVSKATGGPRIYRRADVEQVARIKHLLLVEGLTLAGARRKLEDEAMPVAVDEPAIEELLGRNARERLTEVKRGLRSILDLLEGAAVSAVSSVRRSAPDKPHIAASRSTKASSRGKPAGGASRHQAAGRRKRA